jgi:GNAT superfamily N-acetyltransferase
MDGVRAGSLDDPAARALAAHRGYVQVGSSSVSAVDPRSVEPRPVPRDVEVRPFSAFADPRALFELDQELTRDIPGEPPETVTFDTWLVDWWHGPMLDLEACMAALVGDEVVALTMLRLDRASGRAQSNLAGTRRGHRGRGLARLVKSHSLATAARLGATVAFTSNEERNAPMLAVNLSLGYRPFTRRLEWERRPAGTVGSVTIGE